MAVSAFLALVAGLPTGSPQALVRDSVVAFIGANVVSMRAPAITPDQTVLIRGGLIETMGPRGLVRVPAGALRIDARGKYLMPGLADFHTHIAERGDLALYLANGVTTIANMGSPGTTLISWRDSIRASQMIGPEIYVGAYVNGPAGVGGCLRADPAAHPYAASAPPITRGGRTPRPGG
jgi:hypothetical protein